MAISPIEERVLLPLVLFKGKLRSKTVYVFDVCLPQWEAKSDVAFSLIIVKQDFSPVRILDIQGPYLPETIFPSLHV